MASHLSYIRPSTPTRSTSTSSVSSIIVRPAVRRSITINTDSQSPTDEAGVSLGPPPPNTSFANSEPGTPLESRTYPSTTSLLAGQSAKLFTVHTDLLTSRSPYFRHLLGGREGDDALHFPELDEFSFAIFVRWLYGGDVAVPHDFHSMHHCLGLYCLALQFRVERLENRVMDVVREYYRSANMAAPAYRLDFIYGNTPGPCAMRRFLVGSAAYILLVQGNVSETTKGLVDAGGELAVDLLEAVVRIHVGAMGDARTGPDCAWHEHVDSAFCRRNSTLEKYQHAEMGSH